MKKHKKYEILSIKIQGLPHWFKCPIVRESLLRAGPYPGTIDTAPVERFKGAVVAKGTLWRKYDSLPLTTGSEIPGQLRSL
jgi:hypothetical protein